MQFVTKLSNKIIKITSPQRHIKMRDTILQGSQNNLEIVLWIPTPCNFAVFHTRGADGLVLPSF